jgi:hypothetical protein
MSDSELKEKVYSFCQALSMGNFEKIDDLFTENSTLFWGPYSFVGIENIRNWAKELRELFPFISFKEKSINVDGSIINHDFMIAFLTTRGRKGWLPCESKYKFVDNKICELKINLLHGFLTVSKDEVEKVKPHA